MRSPGLTLLLAGVLRHVAAWRAQERHEGAPRRDAPLLRPGVTAGGAWWERFPRVDLEESQVLLGAPGGVRGGVQFVRSD